LKEIGADLGATGNDVQMIVTAIFIGSALGQLVSGTLSDVIGRRPAIIAFIGVFSLGTLLCIASTDYNTMLAGRILQGFGAAGPQVVGLAMIRDTHSGDRMARISSFVMSIFIMVPIVALLMGQGALLFFGWRAIFTAFLIYAAIILIWFYLRQRETLPPERRDPFSWSALARNLAIVITTRALIVHALVYALLLSVLIAYLSSALQIFQEGYGVGEAFPIYFAVLAAGIGAASILNGSLVMRFGMRRLTMLAVGMIVVTSTIFLAIASSYDGLPPFWAMMIYFAIVLACFGSTVGNITALALEPLGDRAGMGSTLFGGLGTLIAVPIGGFVGASFDGTLLPIVLRFAVLPGIALVVMWVGKGADT
jgi:DHA1 family bicyclomycin/chloramphenicol resistance-like MFS transporter